VYYPEEGKEEEELQLEVLAFFPTQGPRGMRRRITHALTCSCATSRASRSRATGSSTSDEREKAVLTDDGRVMIDTDGCGGQYYGRKGF
jgi:hypothetical protein